MKGRKKEKKELMLFYVLCCNADGSDKLKVMVIGRAQNPRCFKNFNVSAFADYRYNKNAWMTAKEFGHFLRILTGICG